MHYLAVVAVIYLCVGFIHGMRDARLATEETMLVRCGIVIANTFLWALYMI